MRYAEDRHALGMEVAHNREHVLPARGIEHRRRFVEDQNARLHRQGARYRHALLLPAR